ncbi:MAG: 30S ribosomal protein S20 [Erysipelotrichaceae bacterium]
MPNIQSKKKRVLTNNKRNIAKTAEKTALKTTLKNVEAAIEANDKTKAVAAYNEVSSKLDKSVTSGIHHKNYVTRQKSRLAKAINKLA